MRYENRAKQKLRSGETVLGIFIPIPSPEIVEISALAGFDFVLFDAEHGPISPESAYPMILAAEAHGVPAYARIGQKDRQVILKFLDLGISGVMIPQVNSAEAAEEAVAAMKYGPRGARGLAGGRSFNYGFGEAPKEVVTHLNERVLSMVQFEHIDALPQLEAIIATPDLDVLFIGPNDLAQSMGYPGQPGHPEVQALIDEVIARTKGSAIALGTVAADVAGHKKQIERGFRMVVSNAPALLAHAARDLISEVNVAS
ncbi:MAG: aldolase/citrate lyase family protein [Chloroflexota bacterium]|nr:aldolase/citrate lyase family protein [Chloroflexota bacterium]